MWEIHKSGSVRGVDATSHGKEHYGKEAINVYSTVEVATCDLKSSGCSQGLVDHRPVVRFWDRFALRTGGLEPGMFTTISYREDEKVLSYAHKS